MTTVQTREANPSGASVGLLFGMVALGGLAYWMFKQDDEGETASGPADETPPVEEPPVGFDPAPTNTLALTGNCDSVTVGSTWMEETALPAIQQQVQQGNGLSVYPNGLTTRSASAVVRGILTLYQACVDDMFWRDRYMEANPFPTIEPIYNLATAKQKISEWEFARDLARGEWAAQHPTFATFEEALRDTTRDMYFANLGVDADYQPVDTGQGPAGLTPGDKNALMELGYDIDANVVQSFQNHYNLFRNYQTQGEWETAQLDLPEDNTFNGETKSAVSDAQGIQSFNGAWMGLVETAINA